MKKICFICKKEFETQEFNSHLNVLKNHIEEVCDPCKKEENQRAINKKNNKNN
jgi:hypothetical protein